LIEAGIQEEAQKNQGRKILEKVELVTLGTGSWQLSIMAPIPTIVPETTPSQHNEFSGEEAQQDATTAATDPNLDSEDFTLSGHVGFSRRSSSHQDSTPAVQSGN
jgi:hypothetical protein